MLASRSISTILMAESGMSIHLYVPSYESHTYHVSRICFFFFFDIFDINQTSDRQSRILQLYFLYRNCLAHFDAVRSKLFSFFAVFYFPLIGCMIAHWIMMYFCLILISYLLSLIYPKSHINLWSDI